MTRGHEDDRTQQPSQPDPQAKTPPHPAPGKRQRDHGDGRVASHQGMQQRGQSEPQDGLRPFLVEHGRQREETQRRGKGARRDVGIHDGERRARDRKGEAASGKQHRSPAARWRVENIRFATRHEPRRKRKIEARWQTSSRAGSGTCPQRTSGARTWAKIERLGGR